MADPISRLQLAQEEIDRVFGVGYAAAHPDVLVVTVQTAASDWAAARLAVAIERVAAALLVEDESSHSIMRAHELQRMRP
jgi:type IV pilus biogenesis protein CpaD/CtpE